MKNGMFEYDGVQGMKDYYVCIWVIFIEILCVDCYVSDEELVVIQMNIFFWVDCEDLVLLFGLVFVGEIFEFNGVIMY